VIVYAFARYLSKPIEAMADYSAEIAKGNLAVQPLARTRKDEIGRLSSHFNEMAKTLRALVSEAVNAAENVRLSAERLSAAMSNATASTRQITESIEELSAGMENQAKGTEESSRVMEEMAQGIQHIAETSSIAFDAAENMSRHAQEGNEKIQQSIRQMDSIRSAFDGLVVTIRRLIEYSSRIEEINITINDIASQTHLLALNASIEAARAGEQGKGFAVVAEEVRKLADQSANSSRQITQLVEAVQKTIHSAQQVVKQSGEEVDNGVSVIQETGRAFLSILTYARLVLEKIEDASSVAEQMSAGSQEIAASIQEISRITAESSGRAKEISAAAEEQLAIIRDIESRTRELNEQARRLQNQVQKFRV
jgi:methyl-accepting chemotaxis protein